jgi:anti-sigma factor RsiW
MMQIRFGEQTCQKFRAKIDSYIDNELLTESNLQMLEHFSRCSSCTREAQERRDMRKRLQNAVRGMPAPAGLEQRIRHRLRQPKRLLLMAIAAALGLCLGVSRWGGASGELFQMAVDDHVRRAVVHHAAPRPPARSQPAPVLC